MGNCLNRDYCDLVIFVILEGMGNCLNRDNPLNPPYQGNKKEHFSRQMEFTLTRRKIMFGMLLVLVLAFSMQGIADAQDAGRLTVRVDPFDGAPGSTATVTFTAIGVDNQPAFITVNLRVTGGTLSRSSELTGFTVTLTRGNTPGNENYVTASVPGYTTARARFLINGMPTVAAAADFAIYSGNNQRGSLNVPLAEPFSVAVVDAHGDPIEDVRVRLRARQGRGTFSPRIPRTDAEGRAEAIFTPTSAGRISVEATVGGVDKDVAFIVSVEEAPEAADPVIFSTRIAPKVLVAAANRPPMLWVDGGTIYGLVGANAHRFAPSVDNAMNIAVDASNGKVYWTAKTGGSRGTINSANLDGTGATTLASILSVPMGIAVDATGNNLYWTNARGRVQRANLNGSGITNVVEGLGNPGKIVISNSISETAAGTPPTPPVSHAKYDVNGDGKVDNTDAGLVIDALGTRNAAYDVNGDGAVNFLDVVLVFDNRDAGVAAAPAIVGMKLNAVQIERIEEQIDLLIATNDRSPAALRTLIYLQQLLAMARPEKTQLFANYPNPFNPETWIPYELATDTDVKITIYNTQGVVIRTLQFGHQSAGYYTGRDRAAYWDGRNALGEQVASGLYFYQLETDEMSSMRKMVILK